MSRAIVTLRAVTYDPKVKQAQVQDDTPSFYHLYCFERKVKPRLLDPQNEGSFVHEMGIVPNELALTMICDECHKPFVKGGKDE